MRCRITILRDRARAIIYRMLDRAVNPVARGVPLKSQTSPHVSRDQRESFVAEFDLT
jgi:hypothetical protein